jgi:hypothetical protein
VPRRRKDNWLGFAGFLILGALIAVIVVAALVTD